MTARRFIQRLIRRIRLQQEPEENGPEGPEPTRYGDWERKGRVYDF